MYQPFLGSIQYFAFDFAPRGWTLCNGSLMSISQNSALFALLGTQYGGNGVSTFGLPDYQGRSIYGTGGTHSIGEKAGTATTTLLTGNMPSHNHTVTTMKLSANNAAGTAASPQGAYPAKPGGRSSKMYGNAVARGVNLGNPGTTIAATGANTPINITEPYLALTCAISLTGIFPSRN